MEIDFEKMPPLVRAWYLEEEERQRRIVEAASKIEEGRGAIVKRNRNPMAKAPLTRSDGTVIHFDPVIYDEHDKPFAKRWAKMRAKLGGLE